MITYFISSNFCKKNDLQCYRLYNFPYFRSSHSTCSVRKSVLRNFEKFTGKHLRQSRFLIKLQAKATASALFLCLLLSPRVFKISCLFHFNRKMKWKNGNTLTELKYLLFCSSIDLFNLSKISKEILQMVIWSENVFKGNLMLQFPWLEEFG